MDQLPPPRLMGHGLCADLFFQLFDMAGFFLKDVAARAQNAFPLRVQRPQARFPLCPLLAKTGFHRGLVDAFLLEGRLDLRFAGRLLFVQGRERLVMLGPLALESFGQGLLLLVQRLQLLFIFFLFLIRASRRWCGLLFRHLALERLDFFFLFVDLFLPMGADAVHLRLAGAHLFFNLRALRFKDLLLGAQRVQAISFCF